MSYFATGVGSVTLDCPPGASLTIKRVIAQYTGTGPGSGTLELREGATPIWEAAVSGGLDVSFIAPFELAQDTDATLVLASAQLRVYADVEE